MSQIIAHLKAAVAYAESEAQRKTILSLIEYYKKGELEEYNRYSIHWVGRYGACRGLYQWLHRVYTDPLGMKGMWESLVHIRDEKASERTAKICSEAAWFEAHAPIDARFKRRILAVYPLRSSR